MKKLILLALIGFGAHQLYQHVYPLAPEGAFNDGGKPIVRVFVGPGCSTFCDDITALLDSRSVDYDLVDVSSPEGQEYGVRRFPLTMVGNRQVVGNDRQQLISALAENFGDEALTRTERIVMRNHFNDEGQPVILMYGTQWCPYCKKQRAYFDENEIEYYEIDAEGSDNGRLAFRILQGGGYPLTYVGYRRFDGYKPDEIARALQELRAGG